MTELELLNCPCCDADAAVMSGRRYRVRCQGCRLATIEFDTPDEAIKIWNRRVK